MKKKVLIVDDALFMRRYIRNILEKSDFEVCGEASNAPEAVKKYKELNPDLVTMDIIMPRLEELDGVSAIREILSFDNNAKIIIISAVGEEALVKEALSYGAKAFLVKPLKPDRLIETLNQIF
mgnify:CR=1 FL=1